MKILVLNTGSSSIKYHLYDMRDEVELAAGQLIRIGETDSEARSTWHDANGEFRHSEQQTEFPDHQAALDYLFIHMSENGVASDDFAAIGHRVVHGGEVFQSAAEITPEVIEAIRDLNPLAPLHNPVNLLGIELIRQRWPDLPQVAVFDTAFHQTLPERAYHYALPDDLPTRHPIRRYGFHGISYAYISQQAARQLDKPLSTLRLIALHLGNGASITAIENGRSIDTSMGLTPLEGLVMGTRCGDIDASVVFYLQKQLGYSSDQIEDLLNHNSGLMGLCGHNDMRQIHQDAAHGDRSSQTAIDIFCYRIRKYIGAYLAILEGADAIVFTGGIGENDSDIRAQVITPLAFLGLQLDPTANARCQPDRITAIQHSDSKTAILVIPANEELEIARQVNQCLCGTGL